jgi:ectoine hydroxylase-related dioxygenase (phytanoyl-CoA dioxygenase family)
MMFELDAPFALPADAVRFYREHGYVKLSKIFSADLLNYYGLEITRVTHKLNTQHLPLDERSTYDKAFLQVMNIWQSNEVVKEFVFGKRLAGIATALMEVKGVRLYHDQSLYKEPHGGITPAHADQYYWPLATDRTITAWVPLQAVPEDMGPLAFYRGSHRFEEGRDMPISDESEALITATMEKQGFPLDTQPFELGDVSFHSGWTFHRAGGNISSDPRSVMTVIYMDADMRLAQPVNHMQQADWNKWCPGATIGSAINSSINPVLYP